MRSVLQPGQGPSVRMATAKQVPQILPRGQLARCLPAVFEHLAQVNTPAVRGRPRTMVRGLISAVIADDTGTFGSDGLELASEDALRTLASAAVTVIRSWGPAGEDVAESCDHRQRDAFRALHD